MSGVLPDNFAPRGGQEKNAELSRRRAGRVRLPNLHVLISRDGIAFARGGMLQRGWYGVR